MSEILLPSSDAIAPGFRFLHFPDNSKRVVVNVEKGEQKTFLLIAPAVMFRFRLPIVGELNKYIDYSDDIINERIEVIDIELELVERYFLRTNTKEFVMGLLRDFYEAYFSVEVGQHLADIEFSYSQFIDFLGYLKYLSYEPILDGDKASLF